MGFKFAILALLGLYTANTMNLIHETSKPDWYSFDETQT